MLTRRTLLSAFLATATLPMWGWRGGESKVAHFMSLAGYWGTEQQWRGSFDLREPGNAAFFERFAPDCEGGIIDQFCWTEDPPDSNAVTVTVKAGDGTFYSAHGIVIRTSLPLTPDSGLNTHEGAT